MKKIFYVLFFLILFSCQDETTQQTLVDSTSNENTIRYKSIQDDSSGDYKTLGFGIDATEPYLDYIYARLQVIDIQKFVAERPYEYYTGKPAANRTFILSGADALDFSAELSRKFSGSALVEGVTLGVKADITANYQITSKYSYATCFANMYVKHMKLLSTIEVLRNYLTSGFSNALNNYSCDEIIRLYGTHVNTDIYTGGKLTVEYKSIINSSNKKLVVNSGVSAAVEKVFSVSAENKADLSLKTLNSSYICNYKTDGGNPGYSAIGVITDNTAPINISTWSNTINESNSVCIEVGDNSLIPIYEFVSDPGKKAELKNAVENYISGKRLYLIPVVPLYRYCNKNTSNHIYTIDENELGFNNSTWRYEGIAAFVSETQQANMTPFYRFSKNIQIFLGPKYFDHYYTRDYASGVNNGYNLEKIYYVYSTQVAGTVPLKQYYNSSKRDHFYCVNPSSETLSGWSYNCDCCYVYPGTR